MDPEDDDRVLLGHGADGNVYIIDDDLCIKEFTNPDAHSIEITYLNIVRGIPNFCQMTDYDRDYLTITMVRYQYSLTALMKKLPPQVRYRLVDSMIDQLFTALKFLRAHFVAHNDLTLDNIYCNYDGTHLECYIGDFGMATINDGNHTNEGSDINDDIAILGRSIIRFITYPKLATTKNLNTITQISPDTKQFLIDGCNSSALY